MRAGDNKAATINVGQQIPLITDSRVTEQGNSINSFRYENVGVNLTVTPRISDGGLVSMEISVEDSTVDTTTLGTLPSVPVFGKRTAKTVLSITEGQAIVIGGLIQDSKDVSKSGIPLLSRIPLLGALFGSHRYITGKTELILLMTPHIITDHLQSDTVTREFKEKVEGIRRELEKKKK